MMLNAPAFATCLTYDPPCSGVTGNQMEVKSNCQTTSLRCMGFSEAKDSGYDWAQHAIYSCDQCKSGYTQKQVILPLSASCSTGYYVCEEVKCTGCSNCASDTTWSSAGTGKEKLTTRTCNCNTCNESTSYRCAAGYYGNGSTCTACPSGGTSSAGATTVGGCCATTFSDTKGSGKYNPTCCAS